MPTPYEYAHTHTSDSLELLEELLRMKSVSTDPEFADEVARTAQWIKEHLGRLGFDSEVINTKRHPLVTARWRSAAADAPTVLLYGHYDVQPAQEQEGWSCDPFVPEIRNDTIFARGATDDKGQFFAHIMAVEALLQTCGDLPVNLVFLLEGEEECGSDSIASYVEGHAERLAADVCVVSDTSMSSVDQPAIVVSLRGICATKLRIIGPSCDLHSGLFGGTVLNPAQAMSEILSRLHDGYGRVAVPGFYDAVRSLDAAERKQIAADRWPVEAWRAETGAPEPWGEPEYSLRERVTRRPTLEIIALGSGLLDEARTRSIIPSVAWAKIVSRLVPEQRPAEIQRLIREYIERITPRGVKAEVEELFGADAILVESDNPFVDAAARAYRTGWKASPIFRGEGGSIPIVNLIRSTLKLPVVMMGFGLDSDNPHGPDEHLAIECFRRAIDTSIAFLEEAAKVVNGASPRTRP